MSAKKFKGTVVSNKMNKTVVVSVEMPRTHGIYSKTIKNTRKFKAHTEEKIDLGAVVVIQECKPFSKEVSWNVLSLEGVKEK